MFFSCSYGYVLRFDMDNWDDLPGFEVDRPSGDDRTFGTMAAVPEGCASRPTRTATSTWRLDRPASFCRWPVRATPEQKQADFLIHEFAKYRDALLWGNGDDYRGTTEADAQS